VTGRAALGARVTGRLFDAGLGPGGVRSVVIIGLLSAARAVALVMIAESLAGSIAAIAAGTQGWRSAVVLGAVAAVLRAGSTWAIGTVAAHEAVTAKTRIRGELAERIAAGAVASDVESGSVSVLATTGVDDLDDYYGSVIPAAVAAVVIPVVLGARILSLDWLSAIVVAVTLPLVPLFMALIGMHTRERTDAASRALHRLADHLVELAHGLPVLVGLGRVDEQTEALDGIQSELRMRTRLTLRTAFLSALALELIGTLSVAIVAVLLGIRLMNGQVPLLTALVVLLLAPECFGAVREVGAAFHASQNGTAALRRVHEVLAMVRRPFAAAAGGDVVVASLVVRHASRTLPAMDGFSATFRRGRMSAVTGASGSGKSTLLAAMTCSLEQDAELTGRIRGVDPARLALAAQAPRFFATTVEGELELAAADREALARVLDELDLNAVRDRRPSELSPGEARRLAVARAALRVRAGATTALFDEPTAHLDDENAGRVRALLRSLTQTGAGRVAVIVVSHDPLLIAECDTVVRMPEPAASAPSRPEGDPLPSQTAPAAATRPDAAAARQAGHRPPVGATLASLLRASVGRWALAVLLGVAATGFGLSLTAVSAWLIVRASEHPEIMYLLVAIVGVRFFGLGRSVARYAERLVTHDAILTATDALRLRIWRGIAARGAGSRSLQEGGAAVDYLVTSLDELRDLVPRVVTPLAVTALSLAGIVTTVALLDPAAAVPVGIMLAIAAVGAPLVVRRADAAASGSRIAARAELGRDMAALTGAADELRTNGMSRAAVAQVTGSVSRLAELDRRVARSAGAGVALVALVTGGLAVLVPWIALSIGGSAPRPSAETVAVISLLVLASFEPLADGLRAAQRAPALAAVLSRLRPFLEEPDADLAAAAPAAAAPAARRPISDIRLDGLSARWPGAATTVFSGLHARVEPGRWLVVEGPSGSGKTTLLTVLLGALRPDAGRILVDGVPLSDLSRAEWRGRVAWCPQEAHVFDSTIRGNLLLSRPRTDPVSEAEMREMLARVGLGPLLDRLPEGLDARVGASGGSLSGGERQRLAVARALLGRSELLLLDEPTAHLDEPTAAAMMSDIRAATTDRMVVLVSHRVEDRAESDRSVSLTATRADSREAVAA
jgi:ATP-binding cassette subfamily C protein CydCD